jgi:F-type H+-transporting ATPase subunit beta
VHTFAHLSASIALSRKRAAEGLFPAVDPLGSNSRLLTPGIVGARHYGVAREVRRTLAEHEALKDIIAMLGVEQLSAADRATVFRARRLERYLTQPFFTTAAFTGRAGAYVPLARTVADCERILGDEFDGVAESLFYLLGALPDGPLEAR